MLLDLKLEGKTVIVVGGGRESCRKLQSVLDSGATIWVISREFSIGVQELAREKKVALVKTEIKDSKAFVDSLNPKPDLLLAITDDSKLNLELVKAAKATGSIVYDVDNPAVSDFILPAVAHVGDVKIAVSTSGKSPAVAKELRQRIEEIITSEDLAEIELQSHLRSTLKTQIPDSKERSELLNKILNNKDIKQVLKQGNLIEAQELAKKIIKKREAK